MKSLVLIMVIFGGWCSILLGEEKNGGLDEFNVGFEKCHPTTKGVIMPTYWLVNKFVSKNAESAATMEKKEVRNGRFALKIETEEDGHTYVFNRCSLKVKKGDIIRFSIWGKGFGIFRIGFFCNGLKNDKQSFLTTILGKNCKPYEDEWTQFSYVFTVKPVSRAKALPNDLRLAIYVPNENSVLFFDDLKIEKYDEAKKTIRSQNE